jgi:signal transduction histidine kinase
VTSKADVPSSPPAEREPVRLSASLFVRIYVTFVVSVLGFALIAVGLVWRAGLAWNDERVTEVTDRVERDRDAILLALRLREQGEPAMRALIDELERELDADVVVHPRTRGRRLGPPHPRPSEAANFVPPPPLTKDEFKRLRRGQPIVRRQHLAPPEIGLPLFADQPLEPGPDLPKGPPDGDDDDEDENEADRRGEQLVGVVRITPHDNPRRGLLLAGLLLLLVLAGGAWPLARSLTHRLARLEKSTRVLAQGDFGHRAELAEGPPRDEIDRLALAFNDMADRLQAVLTGQQTLLANVSHELRTPIARLRVLVELLAERLVRMDTQGEVTDAQGVARMRTGFTEMEEDLAEVDTLINDLLTSGRLELGRGNALQLAEVGIRELCERAASRFAASVDCPAELQVHADALLLERLLRNLLTNARRACPEGELVVRALLDDERHVVIEVEDEGHGIAPDKRSLIFEPFARLDAARARDQGGVGLGLHLCRQIAAAHGGTLKALERRDGRAGARFVLRLPSLA